MSIAAPTVRFSIGSSTANAAPVETKSLVDMSLDDLIKARRSEDKDSLQKKRVSIKAPASAKSKKPTQAQKSVGISKAKRGANTAARRGLSPTPKPTPMQMVEEVNRQRRNGFGATSNNRQGTRQSNRIRTNVNHKPSEDNKGNNGNRNNIAPPKSAEDAALQAMTKFGFKAPDGMKIVISFTPIDAPEFSGENHSRNKQQQTQQKNRQHQQRGNGNGKGKGSTHLDARRN